MIVPNSITTSEYPKECRASVCCFSGATEASASSAASSSWVPKYAQNSVAASPRLIAANST